MLFKKRKEKKAAVEKKLQEKQLQVQKQFAEDVNNAAHIADPAARIIRLQDISQKIELQMLEEYKQVSKAAEKAGDKFGNRINAGSFAAGVAGISMLAHPVGWGILAAGGVAVAFGAGIAGAKHEDTVEKKLIEKAASHTEVLQSLQADISHVTDLILEKNIEAITASPYQPEMLKWNGLSEKFSLAAAKHIAATEEAAHKQTHTILKRNDKPANGL